MSNPKPLRLVKDFLDFRVVYYWIDSHNNQESNILETIELAREWFIDYQFESYTGPERRKSRIDRRRSGKYSSNTKRNPDRLGRRITDQPIHVAIDRSVEKIRMIKTSYSKSRSNFLDNSTEVSTVL